MIVNIEMRIVNIEGENGKNAYIAKGNVTWCKIFIIEHRIWLLFWFKENVLCYLLKMNEHFRYEWN